MKLQTPVDQKEDSHQDRSPDEVVGGDVVIDATNSLGGVGAFETVVLGGDVVSDFDCVTP